MPIYEFKCKECDLVYEEQKNLEDYNSNCPTCGTQAEKIMSSTNFSVSGSTNKTIDRVIGEQAEKRWTEIEESKNKRAKDNFGVSNEKEIQTKDNKRISKLLDKQGKACEVIDKAKKSAGITKNDELRHVIGG